MVKRLNTRNFILYFIALFSIPGLLGGDLQKKTAIADSIAIKDESSPEPAVSSADDATLIPDNFPVKPISDDTPLLVGTEIKFNATMPITGGMSLVGDDYAKGINLVFDKLNRSGGLQKKYLIKYAVSDDRYKSTIAKENIVKAVKESPIFVGSFGSHALATAQELLEEKQVAMLFPTVGDGFLRKKKFRNALYFRPSMEKEIQAILSYAINNQHRKKIALFFEENQWGKAGVTIAEVTLKKHGLSPCAKASYPTNTIAVTAASSEIIKSRPDAVLCISTYRPTYNFIQLVLNEGFQHCLFLGLGPATPMQQLLKKSRGVTIATTSVVPSPSKSKLPIVEAYRKDMAKFLPLRELSQYSLEGYVVGSMMVSALKSLEPPYHLGKVIDFFEQVSKKDFGGLKINFNPETRELSSRVWINKGDSSVDWDSSFSEL